MKPVRHWKIVLALLSLVLVTGLAGALIGHGVARHAMDERNNPENWNEHVVREFDRIVKPSPEQGERIQSHLDRAVHELQQIRQETIARSTNVIGRLIAEVEKELSPEQRQAFERMKPQPADLTLDLLRVKAPQEKKP